MSVLTTDVSPQMGHFFLPFLWALRPNSVPASSDVVFWSFSASFVADATFTSSAIIYIQILIDTATSDLA